MGYQLPRAAAAAAVAVLLLVAACGGDDDTEPTTVLDHALEQVEATRDTAGAGAAGTSEPDPADPIEVTELPAPDPSDYEGANRVVNLWVGPAGETRPVDVWGRRTFTTGPILLVEDLAFGAASDYFSAPPGYSLAVVGAGAGPDGDELAGMFNATAGEQITMIFTNGDELGTVSAPNLWEHDPDGSADTVGAPKPGMALAYLYAPNTRSFGDSLTASVGGDSYYVGDGTGACRYQRVEDEGFQANVLGGTQNVQLDLPGGSATITLHPWFSPEECAQPAALEFVVEVPTDGSVMVLVYSADGRSIQALQLPVAAM